MTCGRGLCPPQLHLAAQSAQGLHRAALLTALDVTNRAVAAQPRGFMSDAANGGGYPQRGTRPREIYMFMCNAYHLSLSCVILDP